MMCRTNESTRTLNPVLTTDHLTRYNPWEGITVTPISGDEHGLDGLSIILSETEPGGEVPIHSHPYQEIFIVREGRGRWTVGEIEYDARVGDIVITPAGTPHTFINASDEIMRHTSIQVTGKLGAAMGRNPIAATAVEAADIEG